MHEDRSASNDAQVVSSGLYVGVDGQAGVGDDIGSVGRRTFNHSKTHLLLNLCWIVLTR